MRILIRKLFWRLSLASFSLAFFACTQVSQPDRSQTASSPDLLSSPSPATAAAPRPFSTSLDIGVVVAGPECSELLIRNEDLKPNDEIQVVSVDDTPHEMVVGKVVGLNGCPKKLQSGTEEIYLDGEPDEAKYRKYQIHFTNENGAIFGFGVVSSLANVEIKKGVANLTAENLPTPLLFRVCSGNESYHMTVWQGGPLIGKRVWYTYISLSYGTVFTCKPADHK